MLGSTEAHPYRSPSSRGPPPTGARLGPVLTRAIFDLPAPTLVWTGRGVRAGAPGSEQLVHHAIEPTARRLGHEDVPSAELARLLVVRPLRACSHDEVRRWLVDSGGPDARGESVAVVAASVYRGLAAFEPAYFAYEPSRRRMRIVWPWPTYTIVEDDAFVRAFWGTYFVSTAPPDLGASLLCWPPALRG